jgi:hypothetical protein
MHHWKLKFQLGSCFSKSLAIDDSKINMKYLILVTGSMEKASGPASKGM